MDKFLSLICHPDTPATHIQSIDVALHHGAGHWMLSFALAGDTPLMRPPALPERTDGLWQSTCFEMFVTGAGESYTEFNFSPSTQWAAYAFTGYRTGMADIPLSVPRIEPIESGIRVTFDYAPEQQCLPRIGVSAVIEELDGTKSYWALAHPPGKPDFHHKDCFALQLPAAEEL